MPKVRLSTCISYKLSKVSWPRGCIMIAPLCMSTSIAPPVAFSIAFAASFDKSDKRRIIRLLGFREKVEYYSLP